MPCQRCGLQAPAGSLFCPSCGMKLGTSCPSCGSACQAEFAFCPKCGTRLAGDETGAGRPPGRGTGGALAPEARAAHDLAATLRAAAEAGLADGERRTVTVLFADLSGFTALSEVLDPEEVAAIVDRCLGAMAEVVDRYEGTVDKYIGDCVMALFGAPVAHEDDPARAIQAALEMCGRVRAINRDLAAAYRGQNDRPPLSLHVGINTGTVVAGAVGGERRREYTVLGDAVNVAARLEAAAGEDEIVVGEQTFRLARHAFAFETLGRLAVKGRAEPLATYRVRGPLATADSGRGSEGRGLAATLIGREAELAQLEAAFHRARAGRAQLVSVVGEAGSGKSRLLREFVERLAGEWVSVRRAHCTPRGQQTYGLVASLFRDAYGVAADDPAEVVQRKIARGLTELSMAAEEAERTAMLIGHLLGLEYGERPLPHVEPEQLKRQLFLAVLAVVECRLRQGPLLLIAEDVHWADPASVQLLRFLLDQIGDHAFALILAHRPAFDAEALLGGTVAADYTVVRLEALAPDASWALLKSCLQASAERIPEQLRALVLERAGGNPLYLEEVLRGLIDSGVLMRGAEGWRCTTDVAGLEVPGTLQGMLLARVDRLPPGPRRLLQEAAVLGPSFGERLLRAVCSEPARVAAHLRLLLQADLLTEADDAADASAPGERRFRFGHTLMQEVAYHSLLLRRRVELHGRAAAALERIITGRPERLEDLEALGYHYSLSAERFKGVPYLVAAGDWARDTFANEDAARYYEQALKLLEAGGEATQQAERLVVRERIGAVLELIGRRDEAMGHYLAVLSGYEAREDRIAQARLRRRVGVLLWEAGERDRALGSFQAGLALLEGGPEHIEQAQLYQELGRLAFRSGDNRSAITWAARALDLAERLRSTSAEQRGDAALAVAQARNTLGIALAREGKLDEAVEQLEGGLAVALEHDLYHAACRAYANLGVLYSTVDPGRAIATSVAGLELARKIGHLGLQPWLYANLAGAYCTFTGQCEDDGIAAARAAIDLDRRLGQLDHLAVPLIVLGQIYQCHGEPARAFEHYEEALKLAEEMREPQLLFPCYDGLATLYLEVGDEARAEQYLLKGQELCRQAGLDPDSLVILPFLG